MASFYLLQNSNPRFESPAKVFAKLKSKVQKEAMCARAGGFTGEVNHAEKPANNNISSIWSSDEPEDDQRFGCYGSEAEALTLSPMSSPKKSLDYSCSSMSIGPLEEARTHGAFLESTAMSISMVNSYMANNRLPQITDSRVFHEPIRAPQKLIETSRRNVDICATVSPPMKSRVRKRTWEQHEFNKVTHMNNEHLSPPQLRQTSTFIRDYSHNINSIPDLCRLNGHPEPIFTLPKAPGRKGCSVLLDKLPPMSPAKMFAYMKERESKRERWEVHSSRRDLFGGNPDQSIDTLLGVGEVESVASEKAQERLVPAQECTADSADSCPESQLTEDSLVPAAPTRPVLLEDPLLLNSPKFSIPKKCENVLKRSRWCTQKKFPVENVIHLQKWILKKNSKGLFVDGIHGEDNIPWNSNIIVGRVSNSVLKTVSGRVYILIGKMNINAAYGFPKRFLKKFLNGFPHNWKALYENFLSESNDPSFSRGVERISEGKGIPVKTKPEASVDRAVKRHRQKSSKTPESCPPPISSAKMSRSGRMIKPPLEYWKGGRVVLDAHMNVTIHESYDNVGFICESNSGAAESPMSFQKSVRVILPCTEGRKQSVSVAGKAASVPERKVKTKQKQDGTEVIPHKKSTYVSDLTVEMLSSTQGCSGRTTRSSRRRPCPAADADVVPHRHSESEKSSAQTSTKTAHSKPSTIASRRRQGVFYSPESPPVSDGALERLSSDGEVSSKGRKKDKEVSTKKGGKVRKECKRTETSPRTEPLPKSAQSNKKRHRKKGSAVIPQEQVDDDDDDEWSEAELKKLQEAVLYYPKHVAGYWAKVGRMVGTRSAEECYKQHISQAAAQTPPKKSKKHKTEKVEASKPPVVERPVISARAGTLKRKQQVRAFLENLPREDVDDAFSSAYMQDKRVEIPSMCSSDDNDFAMSDLEPQTPMLPRFPEVKTPQCLHITPGMLGSPNTNNGDRYVYQLQRRMKKRQFNVHKSSPSGKRFETTPSARRQIKCGNMENFAVWEMPPESDGGISDSTDEDFYFSN
ncbi:mis18-binding protein 1 [Cololabis saira]|uniref:mis18-binding protein 1 n=1 Tax=Cololabis saira TaxID=129043 RepID=UPI002AD4E25F|nr:mis18-binding protein 1 [Cololabis saira]